MVGTRMCLGENLIGTSLVKVEFDDDKQVLSNSSSSSADADDLLSLHGFLRVMLVGRFFGNTQSALPPNAVLRLEVGHI